MWYFIWLLGVLLICSLSILNILRLEAQEAMAKESVAIDPYTKLLARESIFEHLQEKIKNSKRNDMSFSVLYLSLTNFKIKHLLSENEMNTILLNVVYSINNEIRLGLDVVARAGDEDLLIALPGASLHRVETIAKRIKQNIFVNVKTESDIYVDVGIGVAEYSYHADFITEEVSMGVDEVEALLNIAIGRCFESAMV
ncbi:MAG: cytochrome bd-I oxidase subunit CydX [Methylococcales bacterium]|nr:cytochrome bd-I oxidase subunit CydX [Methylococcales bacterium]